MARTTRSSTNAAAVNSTIEPPILSPSEAPSGALPKRRGRPPKPKSIPETTPNLSSAGTQLIDPATPSNAVPKRGRPRKPTSISSPHTSIQTIPPPALFDATPMQARPKPRPRAKPGTQAVSDTALSQDGPIDGLARKRDWASIDSNDAEGAEHNLDKVTDSLESSNATKKKKMDISEKNQTTKEITSTRIIPPRSPLPKRINRVQNPGKPDQPRAKRTSEEVAAELEMKEQLLREIEELKAQKLQMVAEREIEVALAAEDARRKTVMHITDLDEHSGDLSISDPGKEMDGEEMDVDMDDAPMDIDDACSEDEERALDPKGKKPVVSKKAPTKRNKKPLRGETRAAVDAVKAKILEKRNIESTSSASTTTAKKLKAAFPSGLVTNWESQVPSGSLRSKKAIERAARSSSSVAPLTSSPGRSSSLGIGGLSNLDIEEDPPEAVVSANRQRGKGPKEIVEICSDNSEPEGTKVKALRTTSHQNQPLPKAVVAAKGVKKEAKLKSGVQQADRVDTPTAAEITNLPRFAQTGWSTVFLPTLYSSLACSRQPFSKYNKDAAIVPILQQVLDLAFPESTYEVKWCDKICTQAVSRLSDKRSSIGRRANLLIDTHFKGTEYINDSEAISTYALYATHHNGPALWAIPTPEEFINELPDSPDYVSPKGFLESDFIISTVTPFIKSIQGSRGDFGKPVGALAMAAAAVERAFMRYHTGKVEDLGKFSRDNIFQLVDDYVANCVKFNEKKWAAILKLCGAKLAALEKKPLVTASNLAVNRRVLYVESSPPPEPEDAESEDVGTQWDED